MRRDNKNQKVLDELYKRTGIAFGEDDPVLHLLALSNIILENQSDIAAERVSVIAAGFEHTAERTANSIVASLNKAFGILQLQLNEIEAAKKSISLPTLLEVKYSPPPETKQPGEAVKDKFVRYLFPAGVFALGASFAFLVSGFMWVFFS